MLVIVRVKDCRPYRQVSVYSLSKVMTSSRSRLGDIKGRLAHPRQTQVWGVELPASGIDSTDLTSSHRGTETVSVVGGSRDLIS